MSLTLAKGEPSGPSGQQPCLLPQPAIKNPCRLFHALLACSLAVSALLFFLWTWRWPLVGDSSGLHYLVFLMGRGWAPYRQLGDQQFPGAYMVEFAAMHIFGIGSLGWRLFDFALMALAASAFFALTRPAQPDSVLPGPTPSKPISTRAATPIDTGWLPGLFAAALFILAHGRDGLSQGGQRDLSMAVLLVLGASFLAQSVRRHSIPYSALFGLLSGLAFSIKPTVLPLSFAQLALVCFGLRRSRAPWVGHAAWATAAFLVAPALALCFLLREHALRAFLDGFKGFVPYYTSLGHRPFTYVLIHSLSPVLPLVIAWLAVLALRASGHPRTIDWKRHWERKLLVTGAIFAFVDCIMQARALPYYRYPLLAFLLPLVALDLFRALAVPATPFTSHPLSRRAAPALAYLAVGFGGFFLAPQSAILIHRDRWWETSFITSLERNLYALGGPALSRHIQFLDSTSGCPNVFYRMRLEPASGVLADYVLLGRSSIPIVRQTRRQFAHDIFPDPPRVIVVSSPLFMDTLGNFGKLTRWPELEAFLATRYNLAVQWSPTHTERWWSREEYPDSYRIYTLRP